MLPALGAPGDSAIATVAFLLLTIIATAAAIYVVSDMRPRKTEDEDWLDYFARMWLFPGYALVAAGAGWARLAGGGWDDSVSPLDYTAVVACGLGAAAFTWLGRR
jgi:hypothetical protein